MKPLLTLAVCCYNFERFVEEAVEGAFAQTYRPLEIVISDDHSPDGTWGKIVGAVMRLGGFEHSNDAPWQKNDFCGTVELDSASDLRLVLNRNKKNFGLALHENKLFELAHGEWIAFQAGDDISTPNRMSLIAELVGVDPSIRCIECRARAINANGEPYPIPKKFLRQQVLNKKKSKNLPYILGAGAVYHRDVYLKFGVIAPYVANEDHVLPLRAALLGRVVSSPDVAVLYRKHGENLSGVYNSDPEKIARYRLKMIYAFYQELADLHRAEVEHFTDWRVVRRYRKQVEDRLFQFEFLAKWRVESSTRLSLLIRLLSSPRLILFFVVSGLKKAFGG